MKPRRLQILALAAMIALWATGIRLESQAPLSQLLLVVDGLRPDYITPDVMPRLRALGERGILFNAHHSVFPTVTRVNSSSIATGTYPETHGLLGNTVYAPKVFPLKGLDTSNYEELEAMEKAEGRLLTADTLGDILQRAGKRLLVISAGSSGSALLLNHPVHRGAIINPDLFQPPAISARITSAIGPGPAEAVPNNIRNKWAVDAFLSAGLDEMQADVTAIWFGDPDATAHQKGIGSETTIQALKYVDSEIGRIEDTLKSRGRLDRTNILVISDHGFSTHTGELRLASMVSAFARPMADGTPDLVVTEGAINFRGTKEPTRIAALVAELQKRPEVGAIFTRPVSPGSMQGVVPGTLSFNVSRSNHARTGEILISANWSGEKNAAGFAGKTTQSGVAGHGTSSPYDIHNTFVAAGPDFREHASSDVPTANVDIAPTILKLLGLPIPAAMTGRSIDEALRTGPALGSVRIEHAVESARDSNGTYQLVARISVVSGRRYLDYTEVSRSSR